MRVISNAPRHGCGRLDRQRSVLATQMAPVVDRIAGKRVLNCIHAATNYTTLVLPMRLLRRCSSAYRLALVATPSNWVTAHFKCVTCPSPSVRIAMFCL